MSTCPHCGSQHVVTTMFRFDVSCLWCHKVWDRRGRSLKSWVLRKLYYDPAHPPKLRPDPHVAALVRYHSHRQSYSR